MTSNIFNSIGIGALDPAILFFILLGLLLILLIVVIVQGVSLKKLKNTYAAFMDGGDGKSMENEILALFEDIRFLKKAEKKDSRDIAAIRDNLTFAYQKIGLIKYDAFREMGGKLSFCVALLNDQNDGFIINSVHSSDGCYTYAKEIIASHSAIALGEEEQAALNKALGFVASSGGAEPEEREDLEPKTPSREEKTLPPVKVERVRKSQPLDADDLEAAGIAAPPRRLLRKNEEEAPRTTPARILRQKTRDGIETERSVEPGVRNTESLPDTSAITRKLSESKKDAMKRELLDDMDDMEVIEGDEDDSYDFDEDVDMASLGFEEM